MSDLHAKPASQTARFAAICRAIHALRAEQPKILDDIYARALAGFDTDDEMLSYFDGHPVSRLPGLPMMFSLRSRYTEDQLVAAIGHGVEQYVILGAGLDSFAHRRLDLMERVDVYEVDHPASQAAKRERAAQIGLPMPSRLHYTPIDFEQQSLADGLVDAGFNRERPFFACLLGITQYLTHSAVLRLLRDIAGLSTAGCSLVVEFIPPFSELGEPEATTMTKAVERFAANGEPWLTHLTATGAEEALRQSGFAHVEHFGRNAIHDRYLRDRKDDSFMPRFVAYARADTNAAVRN